MYKIIVKVYKRLSEGVDFDKLSPEKLIEWQNENGVSGMFLVQMYLLVEKGGWKLKGMPLTTILTFCEAMTQVMFGNRSDLPYDKEIVEAIGEANMIKIKSGGIVLEQFHDELLQFLLSKDEVINKYGMNTLALMAHDLGAPLNWFHFVRLSSELSWKPGNTFADGWDPSANDSGEVCLSTSEIVKNAMKHSKDDDFIANLEDLYEIKITPAEADVAEAVGTPDAYVELIESKLSSPPSQQQKFISITEIEMSILHDEWNNRVGSINEALANDGKWYDPVPGETAPGKNAYDSSQISDEKLETCFEDVNAFIEDTKLTRHVEDKNPMYVVPLRDFDAASICFKNEAEFNDRRKAMIQLARKKGYVVIDNVLGVVTLRHMNADCQYSYITVHPPFFLGLESRPPYAPGFSETQQNTQVDAAGRFHYVRGLKISLEPHPDVPIVLRFGGKYQTENDSIYGNFFFASMFYKYGTLRYHAERQAQVAMSKYLLLYHHPDIDYLTEEYISGLCWKSINRWARSRSGSSGSGKVQNHVIGEQMIRTISCSRDKQAAIKFTSDEILIKDLKGKRRPHLDMLKILKRMEEKHSPEDGSSWFDQILVYVIQEYKEWKERPRPPRPHQPWQLTEKRAIQLEETYQQHKSLLIKFAQDMNNWHHTKGEEEKYVLHIPRNEETKSLLIYLDKLDPSNPRGRVSTADDQIRREKLIKLGWTWDKEEKQQATISSIVQNIGLTTASNEEESSSSPDEVTKNAREIVSNRGFNLPF